MIQTENTMYFENNTTSVILLRKTIIHSDVAKYRN